MPMSVLLDPAGTSGLRGKEKEETGGAHWSMSPSRMTDDSPGEGKGCPGLVSYEERKVDTEGGNQVEAFILQNRTSQGQRATSEI